VKTDRRDARTLAEACRLGAYRPAHRTSAAQRVVRAQLAVREALVQTRTRYINVVRAVLRRDGVRVAPGGAATFAQRVRALPLTATQAAVVAPLLQVLAALHRELAAVEATVAPGAGERGEGRIGPLNALSSPMSGATSDRDVAPLAPSQCRSRARSCGSASTSDRHGKSGRAAAEHLRPFDALRIGGERWRQLGHPSYGFLERRPGQGCAEQ
jgi:transposase